jgi:DNA invertase Pin-like site-specific DNA recombinase
MTSKLNRTHFERRAFVYVRQSTAMQVHEHVESKQRQYALVERAVMLGWNRGSIEVIDEDQGKSGATTEGRTGFARVADAVSQGQAGAIFAVEASRLSRSSMDWQRLLSLCAVAGVRVIDEQAIYDPADGDDRMLLDIRGTMSAAELHWMRLRLNGGRLHKARRGELWRLAPTGYVWSGTRLEFDPDEAVQRAVRVVFERFAIEPSISAVVRWAHQSGFKFPKRRKNDHEVEWHELTMGRLNGMLHNPAYAGAYVYGRKPTRKVISNGEIRERPTRLPIDEWAVRIDAAHPGYISWENYVSNEQRLRESRPKMHGASSGAPKNGPALLAGIVLCSRCSRRMRVDYTTDERKYWRYLCPGQRMSGGAICWSVNGEPIDALVENLFLEAMTPSEIDLSIAVEREAHDQAASLAAQWQARIEQARYEARRAERRYKAVDPDNRVVARTLEREWEARLVDLDEVERQYASACRERRVELRESDRDAIRAIARDLPAVWRSDTTTPSERKAMLRLVIEVIALEPIDIPKRTVKVRIQWRSGVIDERFAERGPWGATPASIVARIRELIGQGLHDHDIARRFNNEGLLTVKQQRWTPRAIQRLRNEHSIEKARRPRPTVLPERHPVTNHFSVPGAAKRFGVSTSTINYWIRTGVVAAHRERFAQYEVWWLHINDVLAAKLARTSSAKRK